MGRGLITTWTAVCKNWNKYCLSFMLIYLDVLFWRNLLINFWRDENWICDLRTEISLEIVELQNWQTNILSWQILQSLHHNWLTICRPDTPMIIGIIELFPIYSSNFHTDFMRSKKEVNLLRAFLFFSVGWKNHLKILLRSLKTVDI